MEDHVGLRSLRLLKLPAVVIGGDNKSYEGTGALQKTVCLSRGFRNMSCIIWRSFVGICVDGNSVVTSIIVIPEK